jgi:hypothetical protein
VSSSIRCSNRAPCRIVVLITGSLNHTSAAVAGLGAAVLNIMYGFALPALLSSFSFNERVFSSLWDVVFGHERLRSRYDCRALSRGFRFS